LGLLQIRLISSTTLYGESHLFLEKESKACSYVHCVSFAVTGLTLTIVLLWYLSDDHGVGQAV